jgi:hypothetical protein
MRPVGDAKPGAAQSSWIALASSISNGWSIRRGVDRDCGGHFGPVLNEIGVGHAGIAALHPIEEVEKAMDALSLFGLFAVSAMLACYALEDRSHWFVLAFAVACALGSTYGFLQGAWPFGLVEAVWAGIALRRWSLRRRAMPSLPSTSGSSIG